MVTQVPNRLALVINGATGEKYLIKTLNYNLMSLKPLHPKKVSFSMFT